MQENRIFTFWEPQSTIPPYLKLCFESWQKYLPEYEIVLLNYSNLFNWIENDTFDEVLYKDFSLAKQADAIRAAVLCNHGGLWLDLDTIITSSQVHELFNHDSQFMLIDSHIAVIKAAPQAEILQEWVKGIKINIAEYKRFFEEYNKKNFIQKIFNKKQRKFYQRWDCIGNSILNPLLENPEFGAYSIDKYENWILPEFNWARDNNDKRRLKKVFQEFYLKRDFSKEVLENNNGLICLHNSWMPESYRRMSEQQFLSKNNTLSNIFKILELGENNEIRYDNSEELV